MLCVHITFLINLFPKYCLIFNNTLRLLKVFIFAKKYWLKFQGDGISEAFCANQFLVKCPQYFVRCVDKNCPLDDAPRHMDGENRLFTKLNTIAKIKTDTFHFSPCQQIFEQDQLRRSQSQNITSTDYMREARRGKQYVWIYQAVAAGGVVSSGRGEVSSGRGLAW